MSRKSDINPISYRFNTGMDIFMRHIQEFGTNAIFAERRSRTLLAEVIAQNVTDLSIPSFGIPEKYWANKSHNVGIASDKIDMLLIHPGEDFSFWHAVGKPSKRRGYLESTVVFNNQPMLDYGGGLGVFVNALNRVLRHSPLEVTECHYQSDALQVDHGKRIPLEFGAAINYNYLDFRFTNPTHQVFQLHVYCMDDMLHCELRAEGPLKTKYRIVEKDHHFRREGENYYRVSKIYRETISKETEKVLKKELILDNHSIVMYDPNLIPKDQIRND